FHTGIGQNHAIDVEARTLTLARGRLHFLQVGRIGRHILNLIRDVQLVQKAHDGGRPGTAGFSVQGYFHINRASYRRWTATSLNDAQMIRTDAVASSRKENSHDDGGDVDACTTISRKSRRSMQYANSNRLAISQSIRRASQNRAASG